MIIINLDTAAFGVLKVAVLQNIKIKNGCINDKIVQLNFKAIGYF